MEETEYMKRGWENNVKNCKIPTERSVMIDDSVHTDSFRCLHAGTILGKLGLDESKFNILACGKWHWLEFTTQEDAMAFKLLWEEQL